MRRLLTASALFTLVLFTATAAGQPQPEPAPKAGDDKKANKKPADPTDAAIAAALANDPDVKMAKAKIQMADAELAKARLAITQKVTLLKATIEQQKTSVEIATELYRLTEERSKAGVVPQTALLDARLALQRAQAALAAAEAEWKLLTGGALGATGAATDPQSDAVAAALRYLGAHTANDEAAAIARFLALMEAARERNSIKGPIPERIRAALDKPVKLGAKGEKITFEKALEVFNKDAGLDVSVRGTYPTRPSVGAKNPDEVQNLPIQLTLEGEELPVGAWFQLFEDNSVFPRPGGAIRYRFYVREYGLLISTTGSAPPDAPSLTEFWKQKPLAKEPKADPAPKK